MMPVASLASLASDMLSSTPEQEGYESDPQALAQDTLLEQLFFAPVKKRRQQVSHCSTCALLTEAASGITWRCVTLIAAAADRNVSQSSLCELEV